MKPYNFVYLKLPSNGTKLRKISEAISGFRIGENITMHIRNIYADEELDRISTCKDFLHVQKEGGRDIERSIKHYNLDLIISIAESRSQEKETMINLVMNCLMQ